jgi:hypothetical protein
MDTRQKTADKLAKHVLAFLDVHSEEYELRGTPKIKESSETPVHDKDGNLLFTRHEITLGFIFETQC